MVLLNIIESKKKEAEMINKTEGVYQREENSTGQNE